MELQRPRPLYEQVYEKLKAAILASDLPFGERMNEVQLAQSLKVSRGPVREAMQKLEQEGLLVRGKRNQLFIFKPTKRDMVEIYQCRKVLESLAAELAAINITEGEKKQLKLIIEETKKSLTNTEEEREKTFILANKEFHDFIVKVSGNERLQTQITQLRLLTYFYRQYSSKGGVRKKTIYEDHFEIYQAIVRRDSKTAATLMQEHIEKDLDHLKLIFEGELNNEKI